MLHYPFFTRTKKISRIRTSGTGFRFSEPMHRRPILRSSCCLSRCLRRRTRRPFDQACDRLVAAACLKRGRRIRLDGASPDLRRRPIQMSSVDRCGRKGSFLLICGFQFQKNQRRNQRRRLREPELRPLHVRRVAERSAEVHAGEETDSAGL